MDMVKNRKIEVRGTEINIFTGQADDYISLTDIARYKDSASMDTIIQNWLRNRNTIELLGFWEQMYNPDFKPLEFEGFRKQAGLNSFVLTPKRWIETTNAIGIVSKSGRYGGTFAHKDIAFEFASWISIEFKLYIIKEFQRLKEVENKQFKLDWNNLSQFLLYPPHLCLFQNLIVKHHHRSRFTEVHTFCFDDFVLAFVIFGSDQVFDFLLQFLATSLFTIRSVADKYKFAISGHFGLESCNSFASAVSFKCFCGY
jgi:hypothetical protein